MCAKVAQKHETKEERVKNPSNCLYTKKSSKFLQSYEKKEHEK
jgi:hypothetical protein